jgi:predicted nucleic acid-binding protein
MAAPVLTCDTSVIVAGLSDWHPRNGPARARLTQIAWLPAHVLAETVAVLSRLPYGRAVSIADAVSLVRTLAGGRVRQLSGDRYLLTFGTVGVAGLGGGAIYDAIIGATVREHGATLLTMDRRAQRTYAAVGATFQALD